MSLKEITQILDDCCNDIVFSFNGKASGVMPEVDNYKKIIMYGMEKNKGLSFC